ncbi:MAG TPA: FAD-dependent oxidoreductase [Anaerolineaceae bacterium]
MTIQIHANACSGCNYCTISCPAEAISLKISDIAFPIIAQDLCTSCGECLYFCPNNVFEAPELAAPPVKLDRSYDVIVIGAGIGGLMTAAGLSKAGKKVALFEQMSFIGGKYTHRVYRGYAISTAAWTCPGPNSRIGRLCLKLGAPIEWVTVHDVKARGDHWVVMKDGRRFTSLDEAQSTIVGGSAGMAKVYSWISDMYHPGKCYSDEMTTREYIRKFISENPLYEQYVETIITYCFASQTVDNFSAMETKRAIVDSIEQMADWGTAVGGTGAIVDGLAKVIHDHQGVIAERTKVDKILVEDGIATGVRLADGREIKAETVIHNGGIHRLLQLVNEHYFPSDYIERLKHVIPANVAALILGTHIPLLGSAHSLLHTMGWQRTLNCYAPTFFDPKLAPSGKHALDVFWVMQPPYDLQHELELVLAELREVFPGFDEKVDIMIPMFFTGAWTAEMAHRIGQSGVDRLDPVSPIPNLYLVGYDCIGYGMAGDIIPHGVERVLYTILGDPSYAPRDEKTTIRAGKWFKSQVFRLMALGQRLKR